MRSNVGRSQPAKIAMLPVAAPRHRAVRGRRPRGGDQRSEAAHLGLIGGAHLRPHLAGAKSPQQPVIGLHHRGTGGGARQARDHDVTGLRHGTRAVCPRRAGVQKRPGGGSVQVAHCQRNTIAQQRPCQLGADVAQADEAHTRSHPTPPGRRSREQAAERVASVRPCGCSSMVEHQLPKLNTGVRFPSPAQRGLGELALAMLASYVLTRRYGERWRRWDGVAGAFACGWRVATRLALVVAVSGRGEASGVGPLALCVWVGGR